MPQLGVINVTDEAFGARGDGRSDDTDAIQRAIDHAEPGETVYFSSGTYLFSASLMNAAGLTLLGEDRGTTVLRMTRDEPYGINMASGLRVRRLTIRGNGNPSPRAHAFNGGNTNGAVIEDCVIERWGAVAVLGADRSCNNVIRNNVIRDNAHEGVYFGSNSDENVIEGNQIYRCLKNGIDVNGNRNRIVDNVVYNIGAPGDSVDTVGIMAGNPMPNPAAENVIHGNTVSRCATHGIILWAVSRSTIVSNNRCYGNAEYGIFLKKLGVESECAANIVVKNDVQRNGSYGIILEAAVDTVVHANRAVNNGQDGIAVDSTNGPAERNSLSANRCRANARHGIFIGPGSRDTRLKANRLSSNRAADLYDAGEGISGNGK